MSYVWSPSSLQKSKRHTLTESLAGNVVLKYVSIAMQHKTIMYRLEMIWTAWVTFFTQWKVISNVCSLKFVCLNLFCFVNKFQRLNNKSDFYFHKHRSTWICADLPVRSPPQDTPGSDVSSTGSEVVASSGYENILALALQLCLMLE